MSTMDPSTNFQLKSNALEIIQNYRVPDLQALLKYARLSQQGNKRELFQRCKILLSANISSQLFNKINQIELTRLHTTKSYHSSSIRQTIVSSPISTNNDPLPAPNQIQFVNLPFFEKMRLIESVNIPVHWNNFTPLRFAFTEFDVDLINKGLARIFLRMAPTIISEKQNDVLPPYLLIQCNSQIVMNNNVARSIGSPAHTIIFPTDITEKLILKPNIPNTITYLWIQQPNPNSFKNLPKAYTLSVQLVRRIPLDSLINTIQKRVVTTNPKYEGDPEIEDIGLMATRHRLSLICPITQALMNLPGKSIYCSHLTCFDLRSFLQMNEKRLQWSCPICKKSASYDTLHVDKRLQSILTNVPAHCSTVEIDSSSKNVSDCQYILDHIKLEKSETNESKSHSPIGNHILASRRSSNTSDCIVLSSEDEEENDLCNPTHDQPFDDGAYWDDIARLSYDFFSDGHQNEHRSRKRSFNSQSPSLSCEDDQQRKRIKSSRTDHVEVIALSSSDSSDNDDEE